MTDFLQTLYRTYFVFLNFLVQLRLTDCISTPNNTGNVSQLKLEHFTFCPSLNGDIEEIVNNKGHSEILYITQLISNIIKHSSPGLNIEVFNHPNFYINFNVYINWLHILCFTEKNILAVISSLKALTGHITNLKITRSLAHGRKGHKLFLFTRNC